MVKNIPHVNVTHESGLVARVLGTDQTLGCVVECHKGTPNQPVLIRNPGMLKREFGVDLDAYWAAGGGPLYVTRAVYGDAANATHYVKDDAATPCNIMKFVAKRPGTHTIYLTFSASGSGPAQRLNLTLEEENGITEYFLGVRRSLIPNEDGEYRSAVENLVDKINTQSDIIDAYYKAVDDGDEEGACPAETLYAQELDTAQKAYVGSESYTDITRTEMGTGTGNTAGSDGDSLKAEVDQKPFDIISDDVITDESSPDVASSPGEVAHAQALAAMEMLEIAGVFCLKSNPYELVDGVRSGGQTEGTGDIYEPYLKHVTKCNTPEIHAWRFAIVGANDNMNMLERLTIAGSLNNELMVFVGQGILDVNGVEYTPELATQAVAGKISATKYNLAIWGGKASKALKTTKNFITEVLDVPGEPIYEDPDATPLVMVGENPATRTEMIAYNEGGVLTFLKDKDGIKITEGITTVQEYYRDYDIRREDEIAVMRVIIHAKYEVYQACYEMLGQNLTGTFKNDLENAVRGKLGVMSDEGSLYEFDAVAYVGPIVDGEQGEIRVDISITPVHAARIIDAVIVVL